MKRAEIRDAVAQHLASKGYSHGWYSWSGPTLLIYDKGGHLDYEIRLLSGVSRKRFKAAMDMVATNGPARPLPIHMKTDTYQFDLERDYLQCDGRE